MYPFKKDNKETTFHTFKLKLNYFLTEMKVKLMNISFARFSSKLPAENLREK